jgi:outer membrane autotransporter protein
MNTADTTAVLRTARTHRKSTRHSGAAPRRRILGTGIAAALACALAAPGAHGTDFIWTVGPGSWNDNTRWTPNSGFPNGTADTATMATFPSTSEPISLTGSPFAINALSITGHQTGTYSFSGGTLILDGVAPTVTMEANDSGFAPAFTTLQPTATLQLNATTSFNTVFSDSVLTAAGTISGAGGLTKDGPGTLVLSNAAANTYTGGTQLNDGRVSVTKDSHLGTGGISFYGGELLVDGATFSTSKNIEIFDGATGRLSNSYAGGSAFFSGKLTLGVGSTLAIGSAGNTGIVTLLTAAGSSTTAASNVTVDFGTLQNGNAMGFTFFTGAGGITTVAAGAQLDAAGYASSISNLQGAGTLTNLTIGMATYTITSGDFSGALNDSSPTATVAVVKNGASTDVLTLSGASNYSGGTTLNGGTLLVGNDSALGTGPLTINGGTLGTNQNVTTLANSVSVKADFMVTNTTPDTSALRLAGTVDLGGGSRTITGGKGSLEFSNPIVNGTGLTFTSNPGDFFIFDMLGGAGNTYTGVTTVDHAVLSLDKTSGAIAVPGDLVVKNHGAVTLGTTNPNLIAGTSITLDTGILSNFSDNTLAASKTLTLIGTPDLNFLVTSSSSTLTVDGKITGTGGFSKTGTGALVLTNGANNYFGGTVLYAGTIFVDAIGALGFGPLTITGNSTLGSHVPNMQMFNPIVIQSDFSIAPAGVYADEMTFFGSITLGTTATITNTSGVLGVGLRIRGAISGANGIGFSSTAASQVTYDGPAVNSYTGLTTINNNVELLVGRDTPNTGIVGDVLVNPGGALIVTGGGGEQIADTATVTVNSAGIPALGTSGFNLVVGNETIGALNGSSVGTVNLKSFTLTVGAGDFAGVISDGGHGGKLVKNGPGTLFLRGANTYTGLTTVNDGTLAIDKDGVTTFGALGGGPVTINGAASSGGPSGTLQFLNDASAGGGTFTNKGGTGNGGIGGDTEFFHSSTAGSGTFNNKGGTASGAAGGTTIFNDTATAGNGTFVTDGGLASGAFGGITVFKDSATAGNGTFTTNGTAFSNGGGGFTIFNYTSTAGNATLIANGGISGGGGGTIRFLADSTGGTSTVKVFGNGRLDISLHNAPGVGIGSLEGDGNAFLGANNLTVGGNNASTTFSGVLQDGGPGGGTGGSLTKVGTGTLILPNANTYTGDTNINGGSLLVNGSIASPDVFVNPGGTLGGTGNVLGHVTNFGTVSPGNSPGTLTIGGNYTQAANGTLRIELASKEVFDRLVVGGRITLGGTVALVPQNGFVLALGDKLVLATAAGGVAGGSANGTALPAANVTGSAALSSSALLVPTVNLYPTTVVLELMQGSFVALSGTLSLTPNQLAVAKALDSVVTGIGSKTGVFGEINFLDNQPLSTLAANLDKISPDELTSIFNIAVSLANVQTANIQRRLEEIRSEAGNEAGIAALGGISGGGAPGPVGRPAKSCPIADNERWGLWFTGSGEFTHVGSTTNAAGFNLDSGGVTAGVDYRFTDHFAAGLSLGYMNTTASLVNGGKVDVDGGRVGLYATYFDRGFYLDAAVSGGFNSYDTRRTTPNNTAATGKPDGAEINTLLAAGYDWKFGGLTIGPTASFQYTNVQLDGFTENGAFAPLTVAGKNAESLRTALGIRATFDAKVGRAILRPEVRAAWQHEFGDTTYSLTSNFATLGGNAFTVSGPSVGRDSLLVGAGFTIQWSPRFSTYAFYDGELLRTNYSSHNISAGFRYRF